MVLDAHFCLRTVPVEFMASGYSLHTCIGLYIISWISWRIDYRVQTACIRWSCLVKKENTRREELKRERDTEQINAGHYCMFSTMVRKILPSMGKLNRLFEGFGEKCPTPLDSANNSDSNSWCVPKLLGAKKGCTILPHLGPRLEGGRSKLSIAQSVTSLQILSILMHNCLLKLSSLQAGRLVNIAMFYCNTQYCQYQFQYCQSIAIVFENMYLYWYCQYFFYTVSQKKLCHFYFYYNFGKCWSIFSRPY